MTSPNDTITQLESLAASLGCTDFDLMLVGDGSGTSAHTPCGWFVTAYERSTRKVWKHLGGVSGGTNMFAELEPFNFALWAYRHLLWAYHVAKYGNKDVPAPRKLRVLIVSDSEVTVRCGQGLYRRDANAPLWASIEWYEKRRYEFIWRHVPRNSNVFNVEADKYAGITRGRISSVYQE